MLAFLQQMMTGPRLRLPATHAAGTAARPIDPYGAATCALAATAQRAPRQRTLTRPRSMPLLDIAGMRHPTLPVRLFVS